MEIPLDCGLLVPVINIENCSQANDQSLKGDCIYTVALANDNSLETTRNLVHIPVQCDNETYQALSQQINKETINLEGNDYSQLSNIPVPNKENTHITQELMNQTQDRLINNTSEEEQQQSLLDPSVLYFNEIYNYLLNKTLPDDSSPSHIKTIKRRSHQYCIKDGILHYGIKSPRKVIILKKDQITLLENAHVENQTDNHLNSKKMFTLLSKNYFWKTLASDINKFIKECNQCGDPLKNKSVTISKNELLDPALSRVWREVELQLLGPYTSTISQNEYIVALIDPATEWITARPLPRENLATRIAAFIYETFILIGFTKLHICGTTQILVEQIDKAFKEYLADLNDFLAHFIVDLNVLKVERCETKCPWARDLLLEFVSNSNSKWDEKLKHFVFAYCCTFTKNTIGSPFLRMFKRLPYNESEENAENIPIGKNIKKYGIKCSLCKMEFSNNHSLKEHEKSIHENFPQTKLTENSKNQQLSNIKVIIDNEEYVDDPDIIQMDTNMINENCNEINIDRNQRKAKIRAISTFRKNNENILPTGGLTRLEKLMVLASKKDKISIQGENSDVKSNTVAAVKEILAATKEERRFRGKYHKYSLETQDQMVKYAIENGSQKTAYHFSHILGIPVSESTIRNIVKAFRSYSNISLSLREEIAQYALHFGSESAAKHYSERLNRVIKRSHVRRFVQTYLHFNSSNDTSINSSFDNLEKNKKTKIVYTSEMKEKIGEYACRTSIMETIEHFSKILPFHIKPSAVRRFRKLYMDHHKGTLLSLPQQQTHMEHQLETSSNNNNNNNTNELINPPINPINNFSEQTDLLNAQLNETTNNTLPIIQQQHYTTLTNSYETYNNLQSGFIFTHPYNVSSEFSNSDNNFLNPNESTSNENNPILHIDDNDLNDCGDKLSDSQNPMNDYHLGNTNNDFIVPTNYDTLTEPSTIVNNNDKEQMNVVEKNIKRKKRDKTESSSKGNHDNKDSNLDNSTTTMTNTTTTPPSAKINKKSSRGVYTVYTPELRAEMGRYAAEHGNQQTCIYFQNLLGVSVPESTIRGLRDKYLAKKQGGEPEPNALDYSPRGRPMRLGKYDVTVLECIKDLIRGGEKPSAFLVIATARQVLMQQNPSLLEENGGKIKLNISWAKSFLKRNGINNKNS